jgi:hypothetical protein
VAWRLRKVIDTSQLSPEKRAFLRANPELLRSLEQEIPNQARRFQARKERLEKTKNHWQRRMEEAEEEARQVKHDFVADRILREVDRKYARVHVFEGKSKLICPVCGGSDQGNRMNGKPWCFKCKSPLVPKHKLEAWKKLPKVKMAPKSLKDELKRINPGLYPEEKKP